MDIYEVNQDDVLISSDKSKLQIEVIHRFLSQKSYWAQGRTIETIYTSIENSLCFGVYHQGKQVGFARVVTDYATFAWLCDVFVDEDERGHSYGKKLIGAIFEHPQLKNMRRTLLATSDAHELYRRYGGFENLKYPEKWMERLNL